MIRNEVKLIGRLTADPELKYTKETNKALCNVVLAVNSIYSNEAQSICTLSFGTRRLKIFANIKAKVI